MTAFAIFYWHQRLQFELGTRAADIIYVHKWGIIGKFDYSVLALFADNLDVFSVGVGRAQGPQLLLLER